MIKELFAAHPDFARQVEILDAGRFGDYRRHPHPTRHIFISDAYPGDRTQEAIDAVLADNSESLKSAPLVQTHGDRVLAKRLRSEGYTETFCLHGAVYVHPYYTGSRKPSDLSECLHQDRSKDVKLEMIMRTYGDRKLARMLIGEGYMRTQLSDGSFVYVHPAYTGSRKPSDLSECLHQDDVTAWNERIGGLGEEPVDFMRTYGDRKLARQLIRRGFERIQIAGEGFVYVNPHYTGPRTPAAIRRALAGDKGGALNEPTETYIKAGHDRIRIAELRDVWQYTPVRIPGEGTVYVAPTHGADISPGAVAAAMRGETYVPKQKREKYNLGRTVYTDDFYVFSPRNPEFLKGIPRVWGYKNLQCDYVRGLPVWVKIGGDYDNPEITGEVMIDAYAMTLQTMNNKLTDLNKHILHVEERDHIRELVHVLKHVDYFSPTARVHEYLRKMYGWDVVELKSMIDAAIDNDIALITAMVRPLPCGVVVESDGRKTAKRLDYYGFKRKQLTGGKLVYVHPDYTGSRKPSILLRILNGEPASIGDTKPEVRVCYGDNRYAQSLAMKGFVVESVDGCYFAWKGDTKPELIVPPPPTQQVVRPVDEDHIRQLKFHGYKWQKSLGTTLFIHPSYTGKRDDSSLLTVIGFM